MGSCNFSTLSNKKKKRIRTPEHFLDFYYLEMPVIASNWKNTCHTPNMLSRDLEQEFPLLTFSYVSLTAGVFVLNYPSSHYLLQIFILNATVTNALILHFIIQ